MRKGQYSVEEIIGILKKYEGGRSAKELCRQYGFSDQTLKRWRAKYNGMQAEEAKRLKALEDENRRLKNFVASEDGAERYHFDSLGPHQETFDALTGATLLSFSYTASGLLDAVADPHGNVTRVLRDGSSRPTGIQAPFGQVTQLRTAPSGFLDRITNPRGEALSLVGASNGLLSSLVREGGAAVSLQHDPFGRVALREDSAGGFREFMRSFDVTGRSLPARRYVEDRARAEQL